MTICEPLLALLSNAAIFADLSLSLVLFLILGNTSLSASRIFGFSALHNSILLFNVLISSSIFKISFFKSFKFFVVLIISWNSFLSLSNEQDYNELKNYRDTICSGVINLQSHQSLLSNFINTHTPYRGLLIFHGLGSGKTRLKVKLW